MLSRSLGAFESNLLGDLKVSGDGIWCKNMGVLLNIVFDNLKNILFIYYL